jgi:hypothetical protein
MTDLPGELLLMAERSKSVIGIECCNISTCNESTVESDREKMLKPWLAL